jgi:FAD/FMN-containing dehydrogenase
MEAGSVDVQTLSSTLAGGVFSPGDEGWDSARQAWNLAADQNPAAVVYAESVDDVAATIDFAREQGLGVAAQGTGHGATPMGPLDEVVLLKTERMRGIRIDAEARTGRVEAGVIWRDFLNAAGEHGLAGLAGSSPDVGVIGYSLGGGLGWLGRRYGFSCNSVRAIELVTADGAQVRVDAGNEPELFWALRGGGGNFGVVTAMEMDLYPAASVYAGSLVLPTEHGREIFQRYREWTETVPDELTSIARFLHLPPIPQVPEPLRDRPVVTLGACFLGEESEGAELIAPLREIAEPIMDLFQTMPASQIVQVHMDPEEPVPGLGHHALIRELPEEAVDAFVEAAGVDSGSPLLLAELRQLGGALSRSAADAGALSHLDAAFVFNGVGMLMGPHMAEPIDRHLDHVCDAMEPWTAAGRYFNFSERLAPPEDHFPGETGRRLAEIKARWDPDGVIRANHALPAAA